MQIPTDPLDPPTGRFNEPWHAQTLALANALIAAGRITPTDWADCLGAALADSARSGAPDTEDTYYHAALIAVERLTTHHTDLTQSDLAQRKNAWAQAYLSTPHGQPVSLTSTIGSD